MIWVKTHKLTHIGQKPFKCMFCKKAFKLFSCLTPHKLTHIGEKPFKCIFCEMSFKHSSSLTPHKLTIFIWWWWISLWIAKPNQCCFREAKPCCFAKQCSVASRSNAALICEDSKNFSIRPKLSTESTNNQQFSYGGGGSHFRYTNQTSVFSRSKAVLLRKVKHK